MLALAVNVEADQLVTNNLRDFPASACAKYGVEPLNPDEFLTRVATSDVAGVREVLAEIAGRRRNPPVDTGQLIDRLEGQLPMFAASVRT